MGEAAAPVCPDPGPVGAGRCGVAVGTQTQVFGLLDDEEGNGKQGDKPDQAPEDNPGGRPTVAGDDPGGDEGEGDQADGVGSEEHPVGAAPHPHEPAGNHHRRADRYGAGEDDPADAVEEVEEDGDGGPGQGDGGQTHDEDAGGQHQARAVAVHQPADQGEKAEAARPPTLAAPEMRVRLQPNSGSAARG